MSSETEAFRLPGHIELNSLGKESINIGISLRLKQYQYAFTLYNARVNQNLNVLFSPQLFLLHQQCLSWLLWWPLLDPRYPPKDAPHLRPNIA